MGLCGGDLGVRVSGGALASQCVSLTRREQRAGQDGAKVIERPPPNALGFHGDAMSGLRRPPGEQLREEGLAAVAIATEGSGGTQKTGDHIPAQVH